MAEPNVEGWAVRDPVTQIIDWSTFIPYLPPLGDARPWVRVTKIGCQCDPVTTTTSTTTTTTTAPSLITLIVENAVGSNLEIMSVHPGGITFSPELQPGEIQTFNNVPGWAGAINGGAYVTPLTPITGAQYGIDVIKNSILIAQGSFYSSGTFTFHLGTTLITGVVNGDTIRVVLKLI